MGQFFLVSPVKIQQIVEAAGIRLTDDVVELGAGAGTVSRNLPLCKSLTLIELDDRLIPLIRKNVTKATEIINGDGLNLIADRDCDVLISNLPHSVTEKLFDLLPGQRFRTAVVAVASNSRLDGLQKHFTVFEVTTTTGNDFRPAQKSVSRIIRLSRK